MKNVHGIQPAEANRASRTGANSGGGTASGSGSGPEIPSPTPAEESSDGDR